MEGLPENRPELGPKRGKKAQAEQGRLYSQVPQGLVLTLSMLRAVYK